MHREEKFQKLTEASMASLRKDAVFPKMPLSILGKSLRLRGSGRPLEQHNPQICLIERTSLHLESINTQGGGGSHPEQWVRYTCGHTQRKKMVTQEAQHSGKSQRAPQGNSHKDNGKHPEPEGSCETLWGMDAGSSRPERTYRSFKLFSQCSVNSCSLNSC